jgi:DNA-binding NarL/FixJ family response regulator
VTAPIRVLIVDDDVPTRVGISTILSSDRDITVVGEADNGVDACRLAVDLAPDLMVVDVQIPGIDGIETTRRVTALGPAAPKVIVLTTFDVDEYVYGSLRAGASGFMLKRAPAEELIAAVHRVATGDELVTPQRMTRLIAAHSAIRPRQEEIFMPPLTARESEVLALVARGLSNPEIGQRLGVSLETVRTHVKHVYMKCNARDRAQAVIAAYESGLVTLTLSGDDGARDL